MPTLFTTGVSKEFDSFQAGQAAAQMAMDKRDNQKPQIALLFCGINYNIHEVIKGIKSLTGEVQLVGCTSAGEFNEDLITNDGVACALISSDNYQFFSGVGTHVTYNEIHAIIEASKNLPTEVEDFPYLSAMLFVDGLIGRGEEVVLAAYSVLGANVKFAGAAAADNLKFQETLVFCGDQILSNATTLCLMASKSPVIITVKHGHKPLSPALTVTKSKDNILYELQGEPAYDVWKRYVGPDLKKHGIDINQILDPKEVSKILIKYEAGFMTGSEYKVRFPSSCNKDGSINFTSSIFEGSVLKIMTSTEQEQIDSAKEAAEAAAQAAKNHKIAGVVIFDCACREMFLQKNFKLAVDEMRKVFEGIPLIGFETYGEIAMELGQLSGFHNTTTVVMLIPD